LKVTTIYITQTAKEKQRDTPYKSAMGEFKSIVEVTNAPNTFDQYFSARAKKAPDNFQFDQAFLLKLKLSLYSPNCFSILTYTEPDEGPYLSARRLLVSPQPPLMVVVMARTTQ
jgi:hypothetical protein